MSDLNSPFSPSVYHRQRLRRMTPQHRYTGGDVEAWKGKLREELAHCLGYPHTERGELPAPEKRWERPFPGGIVEKWHLPTERGVTAPLYLGFPEGAKGKAPLLICLQGHNSGMHRSIGVSEQDETQSAEVKNDQDFGLQCLREGYAFAALEMRGFGERREEDLPHGRKESHCQDAAMHALHLGWTLMAERLWDLRVLLDWLGEDERVGPVGLLGESGGGTLGVYAGALWADLRFVAPICGFCSFDAGIMEIAHCTEMYIPGLRRSADFGDILGLLAPRPVLIFAGESDRFYPLAGVQEAFAQASLVFGSAGAPEALRMLVAPVEHRFREDLGWPVIRELFPLQD